MANPNTPVGLWPSRYASGAPYNGACNVYYVDPSTNQALFLGDPLVPTGSSDANGIPGVTIATGGDSDLVLGPMVGIVTDGQPPITVTRDLPIYHPALTAQYILVADDPTLLFEIQEDSVGGALSTNDAMDGADLVAGAGSTATGYSGWQLDSSTVGTASKQLRIRRLLQQSNNAIGVNAKWLVSINLHSLNPGGSGV